MFNNTYWYLLILQKNTYAHYIPKTSVHRELFNFLIEIEIGQSPIQYLKKIRLHQARLMIVGKGYNASEAAYDVGYNSTSQFSRKFKRQFGLPPSRASENP